MMLSFVRLKTVYRTDDERRRQKVERMHCMRAIGPIRLASQSKTGSSSILQILYLRPKGRRCYYYASLPNFVWNGLLRSENSEIYRIFNFNIL